MALEEKLSIVSYHASAAMDQFVMVALSATDPRTVDRAGAGDVPIGVCYNKPLAAGHACSVGRGEIVKVRAGAAVAIGDAVAPNADGNAVPQAAAEATLGTAITAAAAAGTIIEVQM